MVDCCLGKHREIVWQLEGGVSGSSDPMVGTFAARVGDCPSEQTANQRPRRLPRIPTGKQPHRRWNPLH